MIKRLFLVLVCCVLVGGIHPLYAGPGTSAADFLTLGVGPRAIAMGDAQIAAADDVYATYWNPAGLAHLQGQQVGFVQTQYVEGISQQYVTYAYPHPAWGTLGASLSYFTVGSFQGYDATGQPTTSVGASDIAPALSYSHSFWKDRRMNSDLSVGITGRWIQEKLDTASAQAFAGDLGMIFSPGRRWGSSWNGWKAGMVIRNMGTPLTFDQDSFALPRTIGGGISYTGLCLGQPITLATDMSQPTESPRTVGIGFETWAHDLIAFRAGYSSQGDLGNGLRLGAGLRFKILQVDYAFARLGPFGNVQRFGITLRFSRPVEDPEKIGESWFEKGQKAFAKQRYSDALLDFNKTLEIDPLHPQALEMMNKTYDKIKTLTPD